METLFESLGGQTIYAINGHQGFMIEWKLVAPLCKKWSCNRDADVERVNEMIKYHRNGGYIPRMIHLAELPEEGVVCYDGNHRREVFNKCNDDVIMCVVDIMFNTTQMEVYKAFDNINKSVQLPAMYVEDTYNINDVKADIVELVKKYELKHRPYLSTSSRCHAPNFNRDTFTDNIFNIYKSFGSSVSVEEIGKLLEKLNNEYANGHLCRPHSVYKKHLLEKCKIQNLLLFIDRTIPFEHVERMIYNVI